MLWRWKRPRAAPVCDDSRADRRHLLFVGFFSIAVVGPTAIDARAGNDSGARKYGRWNQACLAALPPEIPHRPKVPDAALLWKEEYVESIFYRKQGVQSFFVFLMILGSSIGGLLFLVALAVPNTRESVEGQLANLWIRAVGTPLACLLLLGVAFRSAGAFIKEREQRTWESLLTTPLEMRELFWAKAWGSVLAVRWGWWFLGASGCSAF